MRKVVLRGSIRNVVMAQQLIMDLVWEEMETAIGVMQFMIPDEVRIYNLTFAARRTMWSVGLLSKNHSKFKHLTPTAGVLVCCDYSSSAWPPLRGDGRCRC